MSSLLELDRVSKCYRHGSLRRETLREVSLELHAGELVVIWGLRRSGRSTLLRIAAGVQTPDRGEVRFQGRKVSGSGALTEGIAYCVPGFHGSASQPVLEELIFSQLALGASPAHARHTAWAVLERVGAARFAELRPYELDSAEAIKASIARALVREPALLLIDEPTSGVELLQRTAIFALLRSLAAEGTAVLASVGDSTGLYGADRVLALSGGDLRGHVTPELAPVLELPLRSSG
ncbi:MAG: ATP-binding cassette domain-containing protein [Solirubrobacterales bacterium]|nr:ATP-binding cassette domain-containing protein [Solirubrobacterales bacterium]